MGNYFGDKKKDKIEKKIKNQDTDFKVKLIFWEDSVLVKKEHFFETYEEAVAFTKNKSGDIKIYNYKDELIHSEKKGKGQGNGQGHTEHGKGHGYGHDHHDDYV